MIINDFKISSEEINSAAMQDIKVFHSCEG